MASLEEKIVESWPLHRWKDLTIAAAVSGGADSMAMLLALHSLSRRSAANVLALHFHHGLRENNDDDQSFVEGECERLGIRCIVGRENVMKRAAKEGDGVEAAARNARYEFFRRGAHQVGARHVVTAHTADDQVETVLHRILRGAGVRGLAGIARCRRLADGVTMMRPMLGVHREEVLGYLSDQEQSYREDESNADSRFLRNRLRHELLPLLRAEYQPSVDQSLLRLARQAGEMSKAVDEHIAQLCERSIDVASPSHAIIDCAKLRDEPEAFVLEVLRTAWRRQNWPEQSMGFVQWSRLAALARQVDDEPGGAETLPGGVVAKRREERLMLHRENGSIAAER